LSANANSLIYHSYQENTLRKDGLCSKIKLLLAKIGFTHAWVNQGTFSKPKLLHVHNERGNNPSSDNTAIFVADYELLIQI
jgi:hypothetical protein